MMKAVLLENEKFNWAMVDLTELKELMRSSLIDTDEAIKAIEKILKTFDKAAAIAGQNAIEEGTQFEIVNADPETYMNVELITESES